MSRVTDILHELRGQVEPLKEQSSIAQDYLDQKAQYDALHQQLLVIEIDQLVADQKTYKEKAQTLAQALQEIEADIAKTTAAQTENQATLAQLEQQIEQDNQTLLEKSRLAENLLGQENVSKERANYTDANRQSLVEQIDTLKQQLTAEQANQSELKASYEEKVTALRALKTELTTLKRQASGSEAELKAKIEQIRQEYIDQMQAQTTNHNEQQYLEKNLLQTKTQLARQDSAVDETSTQLAQKKGRTSGPKSPT